jgi:hypothetical protein
MEDCLPSQTPGSFNLMKIERKLGGRTRGRTTDSSGDDAMTKLVVIGVAVAVLLLDAAPAFAKRYYRSYGYGAYGYYVPSGYRAYGYYPSGYRVPYRYVPAEQRHWYDRNTSAFNS